VDGEGDFGLFSGSRDRVLLLKPKITFQKLNSYSILALHGYIPHKEKRLRYVRLSRRMHSTYAGELEP